MEHINNAFIQLRGFQYHYEQAFRYDLAKDYYNIRNEIIHKTNIILSSKFLNHLSFEQLDYYFSYSFRLSSINLEDVAIYGNTNLIHYLAKELNLSLNKHECIVTGISHGNVELARYLAEELNIELSQYKACAISSQNMELVKYMFSQSTHVHKIEAMEAGYFGNLDIILHLCNIDSSIIGTILVKAMDRKHFHLVHYMLEAEMQLDEDSLIHLMDNNHLNAILQMIKSNENIDERKVIPIGQHEETNLALDHAVRIGNFDIVKYMVSRGVMLDEHDVIHARIEGHNEIAEYLNSHIC